MGVKVWNGSEYVWDENAADPNDEGGSKLGGPEDTTGGGAPVPAAPTPTYQGDSGGGSGPTDTPAGGGSNATAMPAAPLPAYQPLDMPAAPAAPLPTSWDARYAAGAQWAQNGGYVSQLAAQEQQNAATAAAAPTPVVPVAPPAAPLPATQPQQPAPQVATVTPANNAGAATTPAAPAAPAAPATTTAAPVQRVINGVVATFSDPDAASLYDRNMQNAAADAAKAKEWEHSNAQGTLDLAKLVQEQTNAYNQAQLQFNNAKLAQDAAQAALQRELQRQQLELQRQQQAQTVSIERERAALQRRQMRGRRVQSVRMVA